MAKIRVYLKPFDVDGNYLPDFIEITEDVLKLSDIQVGIDNTEFDVGTLKNSNVTMTVRNDHGKFADITNLKSLFAFKRKDSIIKITYDLRSTPLICGFFYPGEEPLGGEVTVFEGFINDVTSTSNIKDQQANFTILGYEAKLFELEVPFDDIAGTDDYADVFFTMLNQAPFNQFVSVDLANINLEYDPALDTKAALENKTVGEALGPMLKDCVSVLYIKNNIVYIVPRTESVDLKKTFYGQASIDGIEDIINIPTYRDGMNRIINFTTWRDTTLVARDPSSITTYGVKKKEFTSEFINVGSTTKINTILEQYKDDFRNPKIELDIEVPMDYGNLALNILDKVSIDYPTTYVAADNNVIPRYGMAVYGASRYPFGVWDLQLNKDIDFFKILSIKYSTAKQTIMYKLRGV